MKQTLVGEARRGKERLVKNSRVKFMDREEFSHEDRDEMGDCK